MDGGGRLARSLRSLRQRNNVRRPAVRPGVQAHSRAGSPDVAASRAEERNVLPNKVAAFVERHAPRRVGLGLTVAMLLGSVALGVVKGGHVEEVTEMFDNARNSIANAVGFRIATVTLNGRNQLSHDEVLEIGGISARSSLLFLDAVAVRDRLKASPWIADANVQKFYPDRLQINVTEREAFALWQHDGKLAVIAQDGAVLEKFVPRRFVSLPLVVGKGADREAKNFLALLDRYPDVREQVRAAIFVGERRWNLRLKSDLDIRLPENDVSNALSALSRLDQEERLFSRDIVAIDMRLPDRLTVRLSDDAAKAREEQFKDKKTKKKAGDA